MAGFTIGSMDELDDRFSDEARMLARLAPKASMEAVRAAWARGLGDRKEVPV
ncbi:MAG: hypothetical protein IIT98_06610 [Kiritimatiellae bacterium]|nr:hypothetical protein [Kiritimatiellia bacterium]